MNKNHLKPIKNVSSILLYDGQQRFLLQFRDENAPTHPKCYGFFGGSIEEGESPEEAVKRECYEELEYKLENPKLALEGHYFKRYFYIYIEKYNPNKKLILHEGESMKWVKKDEMKDLKIIDFEIDILKELYNKI